MKTLSELKLFWSENEKFLIDEEFLRKVKICEQEKTKVEKEEEIIHKAIVVSFIITILGALSGMFFTLAQPAIVLWFAIGLLSCPALTLLVSMWHSSNRLFPVREKHRKSVLTSTDKEKFTNALGKSFFWAPEEKDFFISLKNAAQTHRPDFVRDLTSHLLGFSEDCQESVLEKNSTIFAPSPDTVFVDEIERDLEENSFKTSPKNLSVWKF